MMLPRTFRLMGAQRSNLKESLRPLWPRTAILNASASLSYTARFSGTVDEPVSLQTLEGLWWRRDAGENGFIALSKSTSEMRDVDLQNITAEGKPDAVEHITIGPHRTENFELSSLIGFSTGADKTGGLRIQFQGRVGEIYVNGGLYNWSKGFSASMPFWLTSMKVADRGQSTLSHVGVMVGKPDESMNFPLGTRFTPFLVLRNTTSQPISASLAVYLETGTMFRASNQQLKPFESKLVDMKRVLPEVGLKHFSGIINLSTSHAGPLTDLVEAAGSADQKG